MGKGYGIKVWCYWEHPCETDREFEKHDWEHGWSTKILKFYSQTSALQSACSGMSLHADSIPKTGCHHLWPELIQVAVSMGAYFVKGALV